MPCRHPGEAMGPPKGLTAATTEGQTEATTEGQTEATTQGPETAPRGTGQAMGPP